MECLRELLYAAWLWWEAGGPGNGAWRAWWPLLRNLDVKFARMENQNVRKKSYINSIVGHFYSTRSELNRLARDCRRE